MGATRDLLPGFDTIHHEAGDVRIFARKGGSGPPVVLLHGYPQTHVAWHRVAPALAEHFTVVAPDLRGYGRSSCPPTDMFHLPYSKRSMANDVVGLMARLGFTRFSVVGHDRGGRVGYRLALDQPECVDRLVLIDILSTLDQLQPAKETERQRLQHWALLSQPAPIPESLIGANVSDWVESRLRRGARDHTLQAFDADALAEYRAALSDSDHVHATCEEFRAGASCDLRDDREDRNTGRWITCPTLLVWGTEGSLSGLPDPRVPWGRWCTSLEGQSVDAGHFIPEENPAALLAAMRPFLMA
jgi:haloacetate dehalogenase